LARDRFLKLIYCFALAPEFAPIVCCGFIRVNHTSPSHFAAAALLAAFPVPYPPNPQTISELARALSACQALLSLVDEQSHNKWRISFALSIPARVPV